MLVPKIKNCVKRDYIFFGVMWFVLTNLFDLSAYIKEGEGFARLLQSYNIFTGNTWLLVVLTALFAPMIVMKIKSCYLVLTVIEYLHGKYPRQGGSLPSL